MPISIGDRKLPINESLNDARRGQRSTFLRIHADHAQPSCASAQPPVQFNEDRLFASMIEITGWKTLQQEWIHVDSCTARARILILPAERLSSRI